MPPRKARKNVSAAAATVGGRDHLSNLPDGVLQHMVSFLPAQDIVRTCVLAKPWRHLWKSTTVLRFVCGRTKEPEFMEEIQDFVDQLLRFRICVGTLLDTCEFRLQVHKDDDMHRTIHWISIALQCKVRVLQLFFGGSRSGNFAYPHGLPFFISQYLKKLELEGLDSLPDRLLDFSCCPNLEDLEIDGCYLGDLLLISSQSLKRLTIKRGYFFCESRLPINAPNLVSLWIEVDEGCTPSLQMMPSLQTAFTKIHQGCDLVSLDSDDDNNQSILLQILSQVQTSEHGADVS